REDDQRLVLRLPAEARDRAGVALAIFMTCDAEGGFGGGLFALPGDDREVPDRFYQARAEDRSRNPEDQVVLRRGGVAIRLSDIAAGRVGSAFNRKKIVHAAVASSVGRRIHVLEPRFPYRSGGCDEKRQGIGRAVLRSYRNLRIDCRTRSTRGRLRMAPGATC